MRYSTSGVAPGRVSAIAMTGLNPHAEAEYGSILSWLKQKACFSSKNNDSQASPRTWGECATLALVCFKLVPEATNSQLLLRLFYRLDVRGVTVFIKAMASSNFPSRCFMSPGESRILFCVFP